MPDANDRNLSALRLPLCLATAAIVASTAYLVAWGGYREWSYAMSPEGMTWRQLRLLRDQIELHRHATGKLPPSLAELEAVKNKEVFVDEMGRPRDAWGTSLYYHVEGNRFTLLSMGRDGRPDISSDWDAGAHKASLWEFTTTPFTNGMKFCCLLAGLFALPLWLLPPLPRSRAGLIKMLVVHMVTAVFAILTAAIMSSFHLSGH